MSEDATSPIEEEAEGTPLRDASLKVETSALGEDEKSFAAALGFGDEAAPPPPAKPAKASEPPPPPDPESDEAVEPSDASETSADDKDEVEDEPIAAQAAETAEQEPAATPAEHDVDEADSAPPATASDEADSAPPATASDEADSAPPDRESGEPAAASREEEWEEIHPRPASEGMQDALQARADEVLNRAAASPAPPLAVPDGSPVDAGLVARLESELGDTQAALDTARTDLEARDEQLQAAMLRLKTEPSGSPEPEKEIEKLHSELETLTMERDQLIDQLAAMSGRLVQAEGTHEKLQASLRAARGALTPLPDGERALRAEVIGLRGRLEETRQENVRLASEVASVATELAIATARVEDRQNEIEYHIDRAEGFERDLQQKESEFEEAIARHREAIDIAARVQAENTELRSTQAALEETLQARDLEIAAREEHLRVTREGLSTRDRQLVDAGERADQLQQKNAALEAELERAKIERSQLNARVAHREVRIATLTETLQKIEAAMGRPLAPADGAAQWLPEPEWTRSASPPPEATADSSAPPATESAVDSSEARGDDPDLPALAQAAPRNQSSTGNSMLVAPPPLPPILSSWRDRRFAELLNDPQIQTIAEFLADRLRAHLGDAPPDPICLKSLGGSLVDAEARLVLALQARGLTALEMQVLDVDARQAEARRHRIELAGLGEVIDVAVGDLDDWDADAPCHGLLLADALHVQPNIDQVLDQLAPCVERGAALLFAGRIGGGPVQLSASTLMRLEELWEVLPDSLRESDGLGRAPFRGDDGGNPALSCDAGRALLSRFAPNALGGFGHLADLVVGPARGFAFSEETDEGLQLLESILAIDESRGITESLPPRHGVAVFTAASSEATEVIGQPWPNQG